MAVLITGGTGFVGLAVAEQLSLDGVQCVLFGKVEVPSRFCKSFGWLAHLPVVCGDIRNEALLASTLDRFGITEVIHLAAVTPDQVAEAADPEQVIAVNVMGTALLIRLLGARSTIRRVVVASSVSVYGDVSVEEGAIPETAPKTPESLYGISKLAAEQVALRLAALYRLDARIVRLGPVFGPWEWSTGARRLLSPHGQVAALIREGRSVRLPRALEGDWLYSRQAARGIVSVLETQSLAFSVYHVGAGHSSSVADWCHVLEQSGVAFEWGVVAGPGEENVQLTLSRDRACLDIGRIGRDTGFAPSRDLFGYAADYLEWLERHGRQLPVRRST